MAEIDTQQYRFGRNLPDGQPDEMYGAKYGVTMRDKDSIVTVFYIHVLKLFTERRVHSLMWWEITDELEELFRITNERVSRLKSGEQVDYRVEDHLYWIKAL